MFGGNVPTIAQGAALLNEATDSKDIRAIALATH